MALMELPWKSTLSAAVDANERSAAARLRRLPVRARVAALVLFGCAVAPPAAILGAATWGAPTWVPPGIVNLLAGIAALATLIVFEPPRSASPLAYARQLRAWFLELQSTYDADSRRRPEGKE
jgi:hypothetical protein